MRTVIGSLLERPDERDVIMVVVLAPEIAPSTSAAFETGVSFAKRV
jgi:hypothetical protein